MDLDALKETAARAALDEVRPDMVVGLGTGSTAAKFVDLLADRIAEGGLKVDCVPTSEATRVQAEGRGIPLTTLDDHPYLDLTVDGADELDGELQLIKGGGGALLREKIVAAASERMVVIADISKRVQTLGGFPLPVEVARFGLGATRNMIEQLAKDAECEGEITLRLGSDGQPFITDSGNQILDCAFGRIPEPELLAEALELVPGVLEHGLFLGLADIAFVAGPQGVERLEPSDD